MSTEEKQPSQAEEKEKTPPPEEKISVTHHAIEVDGQSLEYRAQAGNYLLRDSEEKVQASIFFTAYLRSQGDPDERPVTFCFNGGPGSSSVWLHLGAFGPKRVRMGREGEAPPPPYRLEENPETLLSTTDLVFIDPVTTGFSRAIPGKEASKYHGVDGDLDSVAEFIRLWCSRNQRWSSPKFLAGASYGTTRASGLAERLQSQHGMFLNGLLLISPAINFQTLVFQSGNDLVYGLFLPSYAATAWFHKKLDAELQESLDRTLQEAQDFAVNEYLPALHQGHSLDSEQRQVIAEKAARLLGVTPAFIERCNLRPNLSRFTKELLRSENKTVGRLDSRFTGTDLDSAGDSPSYDPSYSVIQGPFTATLNHYLRTELQVENDQPYEILTHKVRPWDFGEDSMASLNMTEPLFRAMSTNPALRLFVASGYYDLATPHTTTRHTMDHLGPDPAIQERIDMSYYEAGHMMYVRRPDWSRMRQLLGEFYRKSTPSLEGGFLS